MKILSSAIVVMVVVALTSVTAASQLTQRALYEAKLPEDAHQKQVRTVEIAVDAADAGLRWYRLKCNKINGESFCIWLLCDGNPLDPDPAKTTEFVRYILQAGNQTPVEYVRKRSGRALLPIWDFAGELLPRGRRDERCVLFVKGRFLGHPLIRQKILAPARIEPPKDITRLVLNDELMIGTGRNFRDDGKGRKSRKDNYGYVPFTEADYDKMIAAGINYFIAAGDQAEWIRRREVFYDTRSKTPNFPEELYRSNFLGHSMFIDEPACRLAGKYPENAHTSVAVKMIGDYIGARQNKDYYRFGLIKAGIDLGDMKIVEPVPIWETYVGTSYYQLAANPYGFVQECRWKIDPAHDSEQLCMLQRLNEDYDAGIPVTRRNLFLWFYSQMTGSARIFDSRWGMSIYGQAQPELRLGSMKLACDMGASFIWFWTSDHDHHVPWTEQLALAKAIREYEKENPRPPLKQLIAKAKTAIVLPYGYTLPSIWQLHMWGTHLYATDRKNDLGFSYKEVLKPAIKEIGRCLANDIAYDVIPAGPHFDPSVYDEVIRITEDARVHIEKKRVDIMPRKKVVMVAMRDGTRLHTELFLPNDTDTFPTILIRTTYAPTPFENQGMFNAGYAIVIQTQRGRGGSEGQDICFQNDSWGAVQDGYDEQYHKQLFRANRDYGDFWKRVNLNEPAAYKRVRTPILHFSGWYDCFSQGALDAFCNIHHHGAKGARGRQYLIMGSWFHGMTNKIGELTFPETCLHPPAATHAGPWMEYWLKGKANEVEKQPHVIYWTMGDTTDNSGYWNKWRTADDWPPCETTPTPFYLLGGNNYMLKERGPYDQRPVENRPDVLLFTTAPLAAPLEVTGRMTARVHVASSSKDTDFTVKLTDVYPDGRSMLIADGIIRVRYRETKAQQKFMKPGEVYAIDIDLWSTSYVFNTNHRIRIAVSSSNYPRFDANPNTGGPWLAKETPITAHNKVYVGNRYPSQITLPIAGDAPVFVDTAKRRSAQH